MPPKLRVLEHNARIEEKLQTEISTSLAQVLRTHRNMTPKEALWSIEQKLLESNPYNPPKDGNCPINDLPDEILAYIFQVGVEIQEQEEEDAQWDDEDEWEDMSSDEEIESDDDSVAGSAPSTSSGGDSILDVDTDEVDDDDDEESTLPFQMLASQVCHRWRGVALDTHTLWTSLKFVVYPRLEKARMYISRSHGLPLDILIDCTFDEDVDEEDHPDHPLYKENRARDADDIKELDEDTRFLSQKELKEILDLIEPEVSHWGTLDFRASTYGYVQLLLSRLHEMPAAPLLQTFEVYHFEECDDYEFFSGDDKTPLLPFHGNAPNLKEAIFWGVHIDWDAALPNFLKDLKELGLAYHAKDVRPSYQTFADMVKNSPELEMLTLSLSGPALGNGVTFDSEAGWGPDPLTITSLKEFSLQFHEVKYACALIQHLDLPDVRSVLLNFDQEDYSEFVRALLRPVKGRTQSLLQHTENLKISGLPCDVASAEALLSQLTELKSLNIKVHGEEELVIFEKLIEPAACRPTNAPTQQTNLPSPISPVPLSTPTPLMPVDRLPKVFCPKLESLTTTEVAGSQLKTLIAARRKLGAPLKKLMMSDTDHISKKEEKWIRANVDELDFFNPSDSEDEMDVVLEVDEEDEVGSEPEDGEGNGDDDDDSDVDEPLPTPLAEELGRGGSRRRHGDDLD